MGHRGGEYIWQVDGSDDFLVCWKAIDDNAVDQLEMDLTAPSKQPTDGGRSPIASRSIVETLLRRSSDREGVAVRNEFVARGQPGTRLS